MAVATVGAFALGDYMEGCAVIIFYQIGVSEGECGSCGSLAAFFGLQVIPTAPKCGVTGVLFATAFASIPPPTGRENSPDSPGFSHLQICGFSNGDGGMRRACVATQFALSASHRSVSRSCPSQQGED